MDFNSTYKKILSISPSEYNIRSKPRIRSTWNKISPLINQNDTVAEIGVGSMSILVKETKGANIIGIDIGNSQLNLCNNFGIDLKTCDVQSSPLTLKDSSIDVILLLETIEHLCMYPNDLLEQIIKKLKKGGYLIVSTVNFLRFSNRLRVLFGKNPLINPFEKTVEGTYHVREFLPNEMIYYLKKSGFKIVEKEIFGIPYGNFISKNILKFIYLYPNFRNYFLIIGQK